ncbi:hypothetical protein ACF08N_36450 [Streptomyces sp. NPDC015127]|uniref:hypothetical protein n=1 Tax=Streptomyces sp. NPDC015127 TaxID=3364939 RepID=UPI0036FC79C6
MSEVNLPIQRVLDDFSEAGLLKDGRVPAVTAWTGQQVTGLPDDMRLWFRIMCDGSTPTPRQRPRTAATIGFCARWMLPTLTC